MIIPIFFIDFKRFVTSERFKGEMVHPVLYHESDDLIIFYKPVESIIYSTSILKFELTEEVLNEIKELKKLATELPGPLNTGRRISIEGQIS